MGLVTKSRSESAADRDFQPRVYFTEFNPDSFNIRIV